MAEGITMQSMKEHRAKNDRERGESVVKNGMVSQGEVDGKGIAWDYTKGQKAK